VLFYRHGKGRKDLSLAMEWYVKAAKSKKSYSIEKIDFDTLGVG
jgi:TPR repeat protein